MCVCVCVRACVRACMRAHVRACVCVCCTRTIIVSFVDFGLAKDLYRCV